MVLIIGVQPSLSLSQGLTVLQTPKFVVECLFNVKKFGGLAFVFSSAIVLILSWVFVNIIWMFQANVFIIFHFWFFYSGGGNISNIIFKNVMFHEVQMRWFSLKHRLKSLSHSFIRDGIWFTSDSFLLSL